jgi:hypothetical protein
MTLVGHLHEALSQGDAQEFILSFGHEYLSYYGGRMEVEGALLLQLSDFYGKTGIFITMNSKLQKMEAEAQGNIDPRAVWRLFPGVELANIAIAILSVPASEASVHESRSPRRRQWASFLPSVHSMLLVSGASLAGLAGIALTVCNFMHSHCSLASVAENKLERLHQLIRADCCVYAEDHL